MSGTISDAVPVTLAEHLDAVERWLRAHAPTTAAELAPAATDADLSRTETALGFALHPQVVTVLRWHNGSTDGDGAFPIAPMHSLLSTRAITSDVAGLRTMAAGYAVDPDDWWSQFWVPVTADWCAMHLVVDHTPARAGRVFVWDNEMGEDVTEVTWTDLTAVFATLLDALNNGTPDADGARPVVDAAGRLDWAYPR